MGKNFLKKHSVLVWECVYHLHVTPPLSWGRLPGGVSLESEPLKIMGLLQKLTTIRTYQSDPVWDRDTQVAEIEVNMDDHPNVSVHRGEYGYALRIDEGETIGYVPLRSDSVKTDKDAYKIGMFVATKDWSNDQGEVMIKAGDRKEMAY